LRPTTQKYVGILERLFLLRLVLEDRHWRVIGFELK